VTGGPIIRIREVSPRFASRHGCIRSWRLLHVWPSYNELIKYSLTFFFKSREPTEVPAEEEGGPPRMEPANAGDDHAPAHPRGHGSSPAQWLSVTIRPEPSLAIDLSSRRVRLAQWPLDRVRQGKPLAASADAVDAVADVVTAESVFPAVRGKP
jgi:hypothetical protein